MTIGAGLFFIIATRRGPIRSPYSGKVHSSFAILTPPSAILPRFPGPIVVSLKIDREERFVRRPASRIAFLAFDSPRSDGPKIQRPEIIGVGVGGVGVVPCDGFGLFRNLHLDLIAAYVYPAQVP